MTQASSRPMEGATRVLLAGLPKSGKTIFGLSACALGKVAITDTEYVLQEYVEEHPTAKTPRGFPMYTPMAHVKKLLGIPASEFPEIAILQSNDLSVVRSFLTTVAADPTVVTIVRDSQSMIWDMVKATVTSRDQWNPAKAPLRIIHGELMASKKHLIMTAHLDRLYNEAMTATVGEKADTEKKDGYAATWELHLTFGEGMTHPVAKVVGEVSGGRIPRGTRIENPSFPKFLDLIGRPRPLLGSVVTAEEAAYRAANEVNLASAAMQAVNNANKKEESK